MELLIIKCNDRYIRVRENGFEECGMDKASVFPMKKLSAVKQHAEKARCERNVPVKIYKLTVMEEPFDETRYHDG